MLAPLRFVWHVCLDSFLKQLPAAALNALKDSIKIYRRGQDVWIAFLDNINPAAVKLPVLIVCPILFRTILPDLLVQIARMEDRRQWVLLLAHRVVQAVTRFLLGQVRIILFAKNVKKEKLLLLEQASVTIVFLVCTKRRKEKVAAIHVPRGNGIICRVQVLF